MKVVWEDGECGTWCLPQAPQERVVIRGRPTRIYDDEVDGSRRSIGLATTRRFDLADLGISKTLVALRQGTDAILVLECQGAVGRPISSGEFLPGLGAGVV